jgi:hypothetical protein
MVIEPAKHIEQTFLQIKSSITLRKKFFITLFSNISAVRFFVTNLVFRLYRLYDVCSIRCKQRCIYLDYIIWMAKQGREEGSEFYEYKCEPRLIVDSSP